MKYLFICAVWLSSVASWAQKGQIALQVLDKESNAPIEGVAYQLYRGKYNGARATGFSDASGKIYLPKEKVSTPSWLLLNHPGFESKKMATPFSDKQIFLLPVNTELRAFAVSATRAGAKTPVTKSTLSKAQIERMNFGKDMPSLLAQSPSTVVSSDAGNGIGYTGIRIRGIDPTRVNVSINDIPLNDAESQGVYWVNMPDFASSTQSIQIQRGVGTSANGAASFGASVNLATDKIPSEAGGFFDLSYGSFNTRKASIGATTGIGPKGWGFNLRMSKIASDGFVDRASAKLQSYFFTAAHKGEKSSFVFNSFSGQERTYQAWWGVPKPKFDQMDGQLEGYANDLGIVGEDLENLRNAGNKTYNYYTYPNQVDNYQQDHFQALYNYAINKHWMIKTALNYTRGKGNFEEFQGNDSLKLYGLASQATSPLVRRRWMDNHFFGGIASLRYQKKDVLFTLGGAYHNYLGDHFGEVIWSENDAFAAYPQRYYFNDAQKRDGNVYGKLEYALNELTLYADAQVRFINYQYYPNSQGSKIGAQQSEDYLFVNPKVGFSYSWNARQFSYVQLAQGNREPSRSDFVDQSYSRPAAEQLNNVEIGHKSRGDRWQWTSNVYWMDYTNGLLLTGAVNFEGYALRENVASSYRMGWENQLALQLSPKVSFQGNLTLSRNEIASYQKRIFNYDTGEEEKQNFRNTQIAFSPSIIGFASLDYQVLPALQVSFRSKYVGKQYLDNTETEENSLAAFHTESLSINYGGKLKNQPFSIGLLVDNIFDVDYAPNGSTFDWISGGKRRNYNYVFPMAGINYLLRLRMNF